MPRLRAVPWLLAVPLALLALARCAPPAGRSAGAAGAHGSRGSSLVHLTDVLDGAAVESAAAPAAAREQRLWRFDEPRPEWRTVSAADFPSLAPVALERLPDGVQLSLSRPSVRRSFLVVGGLAVDLEGLSLADWDTVLVRARCKERLAGITAAYNFDEEGGLPDELIFVIGSEGASPVFNDGSEQTYALPLRRREAAPGAPPALRNLAILVGAVEPGSLDILSVTLVPRGAAFLDDHGVKPVTREGVTRRTLFAHTPATVTYRLSVPPQGRLDLGLTAAAGEAVTYRVTAGEGEGRVAFEETVAEAGPWQQRRLDLSTLAGETVDLVLAATSEAPGAAALWGAPIVSGRARTDRPNVIFYVIDGGGADLMSAYGYARRTTPYLERLAAEGALFERAHSNATWTQPSTASFMTSLQHSVLGGLRRGVHSTPVPAGATLFSEHMRRGGYQTASFTSNPNSGRVIGLERGLDVLRDGETEHHSTSSLDLHEAFWRWRSDYPGSPYWAHFQTTDVHEPNQPVPPFAGLFVSAQERQELAGWDQRLFAANGAEFGATSVSTWYDHALEKAGVDRFAYFNARRGLYDETMAHQDYQLAQLVERLQQEGEWERTLLVVAADHGHPAGTFARFGRGLFDPQPEPWQGALFDAYSTRVPLLFVWPGHIAPGQRFEQPVSMLDVLPTVLELAGLPQPEVKQGESLAPLLLGGDMEVRPIILDEFRVDEATGEMAGNLEIVDGRWGASLEIGPQPPGADPAKGRHAVPAGGRWGVVHPYFPDAPRLLLYDLWRDPFALTAVNDEHPELVEKYRALLLEHWQAHRALAQRFAGEGGEVALSPEQLEQLRSLGYIQ